MENSIHDPTTESRTYDPDRHLPNNAICMNRNCLRLVRNNPATERFLAMTGFKFYDEARDKMVFPRGSLPYCHCATPAPGPG